MTFPPGHKIGAYRIIRLLGEGGMGAVYEVEHEQLGVRYALKSFTLENGHVDVLKNKFLAEGKILARLHDPHLVRVFDLSFDETTGTPYFVMDLVLSEDGRPHTLLDVKTEELDEDCILGWFAELASAIDYIHEQGIVHRDIKLGNVLISRIFSERLRSDVKAVNTIASDATTADHLVMGTRGYMAPEVAWGGEATPASDSYSLGVMFVYLLTGIWYEPNSKVFKLLKTFEYRWGDVLPRLLSANPAERPTNLSELVETLQRAPVADQEEAETSEAPPHRKRRVALALAGTAVAAVAVAVVVAFRSDTKQPPPPTDDDFGELFSASNVFPSEEDGK